MYPSSKRTKLYFALFLITIGILGMIFSIYLYYHNSSHSKILAKSAPNSYQPVQLSTKPSKAAIASYTVSPTLPKFISIPKLGINQTRIVHLGLTKDDQIMVPGNIYDTGWYNGSAKPGQSGAMFIFGHVSNWKANGIFYNLKKLKPEDTVSIMRGDNETFNYKVISIKIYPVDKVDMRVVLTPIDPRKPGLNLMTCTGKLIKGTNEFSERLVVFTRLIEG